jgi:hypothetical protein
VLREKIAALTRKEKVLAEEISIAKSADPYLSVDLAGRRIELKAQGRSLRSFPISKATRSGGSSFIAKSWVGIEARPLRAPVRGKMVPGSGESQSSSNAVRDPWGPKRMPSDYDLICKGSQALEIRSLQSEQTGYRLTRWLVNGYRRTRDWTRDVFRGWGAPYDESIEIWMQEDEARLLFWSLPKQFRILIINAV